MDQPAHAPASRSTDDGSARQPVLLDNGLSPHPLVGGEERRKGAGEVLCPVLVDEVHQARRADGSACRQTLETARSATGPPQK